jgi:hypothetical protein
MAISTSQYPWTPGQAWPGWHAVNQNMVVNGLLQIQKGTYSFPVSVTAPGTVASGGTVANSTGVDNTVFLSATSGSITAVKLLAYNGAVATSYSIAGTVAAPAVLPVPVAGPGAIAVTYNGAIAWTWVPS